MVWDGCLLRGYLSRYNLTDRLDTATCTYTLLSTDVHMRTDHVRYTLRFLHSFSVVSCSQPSNSALNGILFPHNASSSVPIIQCQRDDSRIMIDECESLWECATLTPVYSKNNVTTGHIIVGFWFRHPERFRSTNRVRSVFSGEYIFVYCDITHVFRHFILRVFTSYGIMRRDRDFVVVMAHAAGCSRYLVSEKRIPRENPAYSRRYAYHSLNTTVLRHGQLPIPGSQHDLIYVEYSLQYLKWIFKIISYRDMNNIDESQLTADALEMLWYSYPVNKRTNGEKGHGLSYL
ncbi:hypothetical protein ANN_26935 [Periplaneta americana]|uniref:Uncharacterized protein n=1 Tax=Periplaneta americana TaxID=6978 RepID=A0ABQ8RWQ2_PERAM|nr:hypothetical protein ANN_26935 [Periplaneta americana]